MMLNLVIVVVIAALVISLALRFRSAKPVSELERIEDEVKKSRARAGDNPDLRPDLALNLQRLADFLMGLGRAEEARRAIGESMDIYRHLPPESLDRLRPDLAAALDEYGRILSYFERHQAALAATEESLEILRDLARENPDDYEQPLALALKHLCDSLRAYGRPDDQAVAAVRQSLAVRLDLDEDRPEDHQSADISLVESLTDASDLFFHLKDYEQALALSGEAVAVAWDWAQEDPDNFNSDLAEALNFHGVRLDQLGKRLEALDAFAEAIILYRKLLPFKPNVTLPEFYVPKRPVPDFFFPDLALGGLVKSLQNKGRCLMHLERLEEALAAARESIAVSQELKVEQQKSFWLLAGDGLELELEILLKMRKDAEAEAVRKVLRDLREKLDEAERAELA